MAPESVQEARIPHKVHRGPLSEGHPSLLIRMGDSSMILAHVSLLQDVSSICVGFSNGPYGGMGF